MHIRERASDALLATGTDLAIDRADTIHAIEADSRGKDGYEMALSVLRSAGWLDSAMLWLSWRLRPRTFPRK